MVYQRWPVLTAVTVAVAVTAGVGSCSAVPTLEIRSATAPAGSIDTEVGLPSKTTMPVDQPKRTTRTKQAAVRARKGNLPRDFRVKTKKPIFFITIDDGYGRTPGALRFVRKHKIPVTAFLTNKAIKGHERYYRQMTRFGGSIQNHTMTHASFTSPSVNLKYEICQTQKIYRRVFGAAPTLLRPPYGNGGYLDTPQSVWQRISKTAAGCGVKHVVMWDATVSHGHLRFVRGGLSRGDIVLAHYGPGLEKDLKAVMATARRKGLKPAILTDYLK